MQFSRTALMLGLAALGLAIGLVVGTRISGPRNASVESYLTMAATLYAEGETIDGVRDRLAWLKGYDLPGILRSMADKYSRSSDPQKVRQATALRQLGDALATSPRSSSTARPKPSPSAVPSAAAPVPTAAPAATASTGQPTASGTGAGLRPLRPDELPKPGTIKIDGGGSINLRSRPKTTDSPVIRILPADAKVRILRLVSDGEAVSPGDPYWYEIEFEGSTGFVYNRFVVW